jgi:hypothetical protein
MSGFPVVASEGDYLLPIRCAPTQRVNLLPQAVSQTAKGPIAGVIDFYQISVSAKSGY